jgi:hypothetical protein
VASDDKLRALRQYRRARGLCEKCAKKWFNGHKCAPTVQLHAIEELRDLFSDTTSEDGQLHSDGISDEMGHLCICLSEATVTGVESSRSMRFLGKRVMMLSF